MRQSRQSQPAASSGAAATRQLFHRVVGLPRQGRAACRRPGRYARCSRPGAMLARDRVTLRNVVVTMIAGTSATLIAGTTYLGRERLRSEPASRSAVLSDRMGAGARTSAEDIVGALLAMAQPDEPEPGSAEATTAPAVPAPGAMSTGAPAADAGAPIGSAIDAGSPGTSALAASADAGADRPPTEQTNPPGP